MFFMDSKKPHFGAVARQRESNPNYTNFDETRIIIDECCIIIDEPIYR